MVANSNQKVIIIRVELTNDNGVLHFDKHNVNGELINVLIDVFDELYISNNSMTFHYGDIDVDINITTGGMICTAKRDSFAPWFFCEEIVIYIEAGCVNMLGLRNEDCIMQTRILCDEDM